MIHSFNAIPARAGGIRNDITIDKLAGLASWMQFDSLFLNDASPIGSSMQDKATTAWNLVGTGGTPVLTYNVVNGKKGALFTSAKAITYSTSGGAHLVNNKGGFTCHAVIKLVAGSTFTGNRTIWGASYPGTFLGAGVQFCLVGNQVGFIGRRVAGDSIQTVIPSTGVGTVIANEAFLYSCRVNFQTRTVDLYKNGVNVLSTTTFGTSGNTAAVDGDSTQTNYWGAGPNGYQNFFQSEYFLEGVLCTVASSDSDMQAAFAHLNKEYALW